MKKSEEVLVPVETVFENGFFRKRTGTFVYKVISVSSAKFLRLSDQYIYGVTHNGNVASVKKGTLVVPTTVLGFLDVYIRPLSSVEEGELDPNVDYEECPQ
jgi:hypothetical protein